MREFRASVEPIVVDGNRTGELLVRTQSGEVTVRPKVMGRWERVKANAAHLLLTCLAEAEYGADPLQYDRMCTVVDLGIFYEPPLPQGTNRELVEGLYALRIRSTREIQMERQFGWSRAARGIGL